VSQPAWRIDAVICAQKMDTFLLRWQTLGFAALASLSVLAALYASDRGFDISDEAYYVLSARYARDIEAYISPQHWILAPLWAVTGSLQSFRLAGLAIFVLSSAMLAFGVAVSVRRSVSHDAAPGLAPAFAASLTGALVYLTTINLSPSYNLLASAGCSGAIGMTLVAGATRGVWSRALFVAAAGLCLTVEFISKPSSGIATFGLLSVFLWATSGRSAVAAALWIAVGGVFAATTVIAALSQGPWDQTHSALADGLALFRVVQSEGVPARLLRYAAEYGQHITWTAIKFAPYEIVFGIYLLRRRPAAALVSVCLLAAILILGGHILGGSDRGQSALPQIEGLVVVLLSALLLAWPLIRNDRRLLVIVLGLLLAPYSVAVGTGNSIFTQVIVTLAPWAAALTIISALIAARDTDGFLLRFFTVIFAVACAGQTLTSLFRVPYHQIAAYWYQNVPVTIGPLGKVRVDPATAAFVAALDATAVRCGIPPGRPYVGLYDVPGVSLAFSAVPVKSPWINNLNQAKMILTPERMATIGDVIVARRIGWDGSWPVLPSTIGKLTIDYTFCGAATYPFADQKVEIWVSR
jgi:hypothetical protein